MYQVVTTESGKVKRKEAIIRKNKVKYKIERLEILRVMVADIPGPSI